MPFAWSQYVLIVPVKDMVIMLYLGTSKLDGAEQATLL
jgi:hypothetical protein